MLASKLLFAREPKNLRLVTFVATLVEPAKGFPLGKTKINRRDRAPLTVDKQPLNLSFSVSATGEFSSALPDPHPSHSDNVSISLLCLALSWFPFTLSGSVFGLVSVWVVCKHVGQVEMPGFWVLGVSSLIDLSIRAPRTEHSGRCQIGCISVPVSGFESPGATIFGFGFILSEYSSHSTSFYSTSLPPSTSPHTSPSQQHLAGGVGGACPHSVDSKDLAGNNPMLCRCPRRHL